MRLRDPKWSAMVLDEATRGRERSERQAKKLREIMGDRDLPQVAKWIAEAERDAARHRRTIEAMKEAA